MSQFRLLKLRRSSSIDFVEFMALSRLVNVSVSVLKLSKGEHWTLTCLSVRGSLLV